MRSHIFLLGGSAAPWPISGSNVHVRRHPESYARAAARETSVPNGPSYEFSFGIFPEATETFLDWVHNKVGSPMADTFGLGASWQKTDG
jgi:hypothetical protein